MDTENEETTLAVGDRARKSGDVSKAKEIYREVLLRNPTCSKAHFKLASILKESANSASSLVHFQTAIILDPHCTSYRLAYIEALIQEGEYEQAIQESRSARDIEEDQNNESTLSKLLPQSCTNINHDDLEQFYKGSIQDVLASAIQGWVFAMNFDFSFIEQEDSKYFFDMEEAAKIDINSVTPDEYEYANPNKILVELNQEPEPEKKYERIMSLIDGQHPVLLFDSFGQRGSSLSEVETSIASGEGKLNVVVVGGGVTGLFLACTLKNVFKREIFITVLDNRSDSQGLRKPFNRNWLTHIPSRTLLEWAPNNISELLSCMGDDGYVGLPLNAIEAILMLSCKEQGVKFCFSPDINISELDLNNTSLIFDATGGKLNAQKEYSGDWQEYNVNVTVPAMNHSSSGIAPIRHLGFLPTNPFRVTLKPFEGVHCPHTEEGKISYYMVKLTGIPAQLLPCIRSFATDRNADNIFYIWEGHLKETINEGLVFINLTSSQASTLSGLIRAKLELKMFIRSCLPNLSVLDDRVLKLMESLERLDEKSSIKIEPPFSFDPYINMLGEVGRIKGRNIYPIGDSIYCGHPKQGNGLGYHLKFINSLVAELKRFAEKKFA